MESDKNRRYKKELNKLKKYYKGLKENEKKVCEGLIQNSAFMKVTLEDLQKTIDAEGAIDEYQNGAEQFGKKPSAAIQSYNALVKNYLGVQKKLLEMLPPENKRSKLEDFILNDD